MGEIQFEDQGEEFGRPPERASGFDLTGKLVEWGIVSTGEQAQYILLGAAVLAMLAAAYLFFHSGGSSLPPPPPIS